MMDARRRACLQAMGIDRWEPRSRPVAPRPVEVVAAPVVAVEVSPPGPPPVVAPAPVVAAEPVVAPEPVAAAEPVAAPEPTPVVADWDTLAAAVAACTRCPALVASRSRTVFGTGNREAEWMVIGEAPGEEEDRQGEPFVGRAGQLLNAMLQAIGLPRPTVYIANILKCRPPANRDPASAEAANCRPFLTRQIELVAPRLILVVGRTAAQNLLGTTEAVGRLRGREHRHPELGVPLVVTYHPAYLLRKPDEKRRAWDDLRLARRLFQSLPAKRPGAAP